MERRVVFVGGGNMACSLIGGLRHAGSPATVTVVEPDAAKHAALTEAYAVDCVSQASPEVMDADAVVLAVKPQILPDVATELAESMTTSSAAVISVAAGVPLAALVHWFGEKRAIVRCMPNTPALIGAGITGLYAPPGVDQQTRQLADDILTASGQTVWVDAESKLNTVTAVSGSGPAYFFAFMEALQTAAENEGLDPATARQLVTQTALGAARMVEESGDDAGTLRAKVTSPGGTTEKALGELTSGQVDVAINRAVEAAASRAGELADDLDPS
ncbi:pyrroline-5-carboxylate reductase [Salinisphaera sp. USBA-960]|nr:pyrroline-5-carboxylate reductase [Salifodinibacter halophilus]NNC26962.1 pyrroline-5-carboxylate reductase [Salifodinibacter halophilus]